MSHTLLRITRLDEGFLLEEGEDGKKCGISTGADMIEKVREVFSISNNGVDVDVPVQQDLKRETLAESIWLKMINNSEPPKLCQEICPAANAKQDRTRHLLTERIEPVHSDEFVFRECTAFDWRSIPEKQFGKTRIRQSGGLLRIERDGYETRVWSSLESLKRLKTLIFDNRPGYRAALRDISMSKRTVLSACLNEVDLSKLDDVEREFSNATPAAQGVTADVHDENEMSEHTKRLREIAREKQNKWRAEKENTARAEQ